MVLSRFLVLFINIYDDNDDEVALAVIPLIFLISINMKMRHVNGFQRLFIENVFNFLMSRLDQSRKLPVRKLITDIKNLNFNGF